MMNDDIVLLLDESMNLAISGIAQDLCGKSAMTPIPAPPAPFPYIRLFETPSSPHGAVAQQLHAAAAAVCQERQASPLTGRLLRWAIEHGELRLLAEVSEPSFQDLEQRLERMLPSGRPCRHSHAVIVVGSIEQIDPAVHSAFLAAVEDAYPIVVDRATFNMTKAVVRAANLSAGTTEMMPHIELTNTANKPSHLKNTSTTTSKAKAPPKTIKVNTAAATARTAPKAAKAQPMDLDSLIRSQSSIQKKKNQKKKKTKNQQQQQLAGTGAAVARAPQPRASQASTWQYKKPVGPVREKGWNRLVRVVKP